MNVFLCQKSQFYFLFSFLLGVWCCWNSNRKRKLVGSAKNALLFSRKCSFSGLAWRIWDTYFASCFCGIRWRSISNVSRTFCLERKEVSRVCTRAANNAGLTAAIQSNNVSSSQHLLGLEWLIWAANAENVKQMGKNRISCGTWRTRSKAGISNLLNHSRLLHDVQPDETCATSRPFCFWDLTEHRCNSINFGFQLRCYILEREPGRFKIWQMEGLKARTGWNTVPRSARVRAALGSKVCGRGPPFEGHINLKKINMKK